MAIYYVSPFGSDANNGLGADPTAATNKPWLTLGKVLGAAGVASGDTCYVCPGTYAELVTVAMTSATATTSLSGDVSNAQGFCDGSGTRLRGGPVVWCSANPSSGAALCDFAGRDYLSFSDLVLVGDGNGSIITATTTTSTNCALSRLALFAQSNNTNVAAVNVTTVFGTALAWTVDACQYFGRGNLIGVNLPSGSGADYDANVIVTNCVAVDSNTALVKVTGTGASAQFGGGVLVKNCTSVNGPLISTTAALISTSIPCQALNCWSLGTATALNAGTSGQITEDYNFLQSSTARSNVTVGTHSAADTSNYPIFVNFWSAYRALRLAPALEPVLFGMVLGFGNSSGTSTDLRGLPRPCGTMTFGDSGTATSGAAATLTQSTKAWGTNQWALGTGAPERWVVKITGGTGSGQVKQIKSNTATALTVDGNWVTNPDNTSTYVIYRGNQATGGKATAGAATTLTDSGAAWAANQWMGWTLTITSGTGSGQTTTVSSNTATVLTVPTWGTNPDNTSVYKMYRGTDENTVAPACGAYERGNTMVMQATTVRTGSNALRAMGPAVQDFELPVSAALTTLTVYVRWDATYAGTKPQFAVLNGEECGVTAASVTATGAIDTWELLTLTFTPARAGVVTVRLQANSTATLGFSYWDDFNAAPAVTPNGMDFSRRGEPLGSLIAPTIATAAHHPIIGGSIVRAM